MTSDYYGNYWRQGMDRWTPRGLEVLAAEAALVGRYVRPDMKALDVGCGDGRLARLLLNLKADYTGVDVSESAVDLCRRQGLRVSRQDLNEALPFDENNFDVATIFEVLEHLFAPDAAIREVVRVLKPGGIVIGSVPNVAYFPNRLLMLAGRFNPGGSPATSLKKPWLDPHIRFFSFSAMNRFLKTEIPLVVEKLAGAPFDLSQLPVLYKFPGKAKRRLRMAGKIIGFLGTVFPRLFSERIYFVARKNAGNG